MRMVVWGDCYPRLSGVATFVGNLAQALAARGHAVTILAEGEPGREPVRLESGAAGPSVPVWRVPPGRWDPGAVAVWLADVRPDVVHYNAQGAGCASVLAALQAEGAGLPLVTTLHHDLASLTAPADLADLGRLCARSHAVAVVSEHARGTFDAACPDRAGTTVVIANALPPAEADASAGAGAAVGPAVPGHIVALGRMVRDKGFDVLVEAFGLIAATHPGARVTLWGDGPERAALAARVAALGLAGRVALPGPCQPADVAKALAAASVVVVPSRWQEPFGLVALEAAQAARPVIASRTGALPAIVAQGETGLLVPPEDPAALAGALAELLAAPTRAAAMGRAGQDMVARRFGFAAMVDAYERLLAAAAGKAGG